MILWWTKKVQQKKIFSKCLLTKNILITILYSFLLDSKFIKINFFEIMEDNNTKLIIIKEISNKEEILFKYRGINPTHCRIEIYNNYSVNNWRIIISKVLIPLISSSNMLKLTCNDLKLFQKVIEQIFSKCLLTERLLNLFTP